MVLIMTNVFTVIIHKSDGISGFGGVFSTPELAKDVVDKWNKRFGTSDLWADYISTEVDDAYILD